MITAEQLRMARAALDWSARELCDKTGLHRNTISNIENGGELRASTEALLQIEFQKNGIEFVNVTDKTVGVILNR
jgi:transcriptional regulator with XRE-family HTH domain